MQIAATSLNMKRRSVGLIFGCCKVDNEQSGKGIRAFWEELGNKKEMTSWDIERERT